MSRFDTSPARLSKGLKLFQEGRVKEVTARVFLVDSGTIPGKKYVVVIGEGRARGCNCRWDGEGACSHLLGANAYINHELNQRDPFRGLPSEEYPNGRPLRAVD